MVGSVHVLGCPDEVVASRGWSMLFEGCAGACVG